MKTTILLISVLLFASSFLHAQIDKGKVQIGGSVSVFNRKAESNQFNPAYKTTTIYASPSIGKFYDNNKLIGFFLDYSYFESTDYPNLVRSYGGGIFLRQYQPVVNKLYILFEERGSYNYLQGRNYIGSLHGQSINISAQAGMAYDVARKMQLELIINSLISAGYTKTNQQTSYNISSSLEGNSFSGITLGFRYYLK